MGHFGRLGLAATLRQRCPCLTQSPEHRRLSLTVICSVEHIVRSHLATQSAVFRPKKDVRITLASFQLQGKWDSEADTLVVGLGHIDSVETKDWNMEDKTTPNSH